MNRYWLCGGVCTCICNCSFGRAPSHWSCRPTTLGMSSHHIDRVPPDISRVTHHFGHVTGHGHHTGQVICVNNFSVWQLTTWIVGNVRHGAEKSSHDRSPRCQRRHRVSWRLNKSSGICGSCKIGGRCKIEFRRPQMCGEKNRLGRFGDDTVGSWGLDVVSF